MSSKAVYSKLLAFYKLLYSVVIESDKFNEVDAKILEDSFLELKEVISLPDCTVSSLRDAHKECQNEDNDADIEMKEELAGYAFADLAAQLKDPECSELIQQFIDDAGTSGPEDLYLQAVNIRPLSSGNPENGPAVVTLVVQNLDALVDLLENGKKANTEYLHFSRSKKLNTEPDASE